MAPGNRGPWPGGIGASTAAWAVAWGVACGTAEPPPGPEEVVRAYLRAVEADDPAAVVPLLYAPAREYLARAAERAGDQVGGRKNFEPADLLEVLDAPAGISAARVALRPREGGGWVARVETADGVVRTLEVVQEDEGPRVVVPLPAAGKSPP